MKIVMLYGIQFLAEIEAAKGFSFHFAMWGLTFFLARVEGSFGPDDILL